MLFAVAPAGQVKASEAMLLQLGADLSALRWPGAGDSPWSWGAIRYARLALGGMVYGDRQAVAVTSDIWIAQKFVEKGLEAEIRAVIEGHRDRI